jgi:hypothetical protein
MTEAERLRDEAARALRLSEQIIDEQARKALAALAADLLKRAEAIERENTEPARQPPFPPQQPAQQQQEQIQPKDVDRSGEC